MCDEADATEGALGLLPVVLQLCPDTLVFVVDILLALPLLYFVKPEELVVAVDIMELLQFDDALEVAPLLVTLLGDTARSVDRRAW